MLREIQRVAQRSVDRRKRWFQDEYFDLYIWQDLAGEVLEIQVCYERGRPSERALTWKRGVGFAHAKVDAGMAKESGPSIAAPLLREGGKFGGWRVRERLGAAAATLERGLSEFVLDKVKDYCDPPHRFRRPGRAAPDWLRRLRRQARL
jgi:hypothetical protein